MGTCAAKGMNETWQKWWDYREREKEGGILPHQQFCNDFCHYTTSKTTWLPDFFSVHLITCMPYCIVFYRSDVLHHWQKKRVLYQTQCQRCYFPLVFLYLFLFLLESKYKYTTTADGETITFEVLDTISEVPAQFVSSVFQNIFYYCLLLINNF